MLHYVKIRKIPCPLALDYTNESSFLQGDKFSPKMATTFQPSEFRNFFFYLKQNKFSFWSISRGFRSTEDLVNTIIHVLQAAIYNC